MSELVVLNLRSSYTLNEAVFTAVNLSGYEILMGERDGFLHSLLTHDDLDLAADLREILPIATEFKTILSRELEASYYHGKDSVLEIHNLRTFSEKDPSSGKYLLDLDNVTLKRNSLYKWFLRHGYEIAGFEPLERNECDTGVVPEESEQDDSTLSPNSPSHTSELLEVLDHAIKEHWEGHKPQQPPKKEAILAWLEESYPELSSREKGAIDLIMRPKRYK